MPHRIRRAARLRHAQTKFAHADLALSLGALVDALTQAHALAAGGGHSADLVELLARARHELDLADEKLLALDRYRQRSFFRRAGRIRARIAGLQKSVAPRSV